MKRRHFISTTFQATAMVSVLGLMACKDSKKMKESTVEEAIDHSLFFKISLAEWSFHRALQGGKMDNFDFAAKSRSIGCEGLEYVNQFFKDKAKNTSYLKELNFRANAEGQQNVLIMIDGEGSLADSVTDKRLKAIENHYQWVDAANFLGCNAIRVNLAGGLDKNEALKASIDSLNRLSEFAKGSNINILVENHGGFSSNGQWMTEVFSQIKNENCGTLPDFGNFCIERNEKGNCFETYDRYKGIKELLPFAKAVSAKSYSFDANGNEELIDYLKVMKMVKDSGYRGFVGVEFEGDKVSEDEGARLTYDLLKKAGKQLS